MYFHDQDNKDGYFLVSLLEGTVCSACEYSIFTGQWNIQQNIKEFSSCISNHKEINTLKS